jgi:hypothetical protein
MFLRVIKSGLLPMGKPTIFGAAKGAKDNAKRGAMIRLQLEYLRS